MFIPYKSTDIKNSQSTCSFNPEVFGIAKYLYMNTSNLLHLKISKDHLFLLASFSLKWCFLLSVLSLNIKDSLMFKSMDSTSSINTLWDQLQRLWRTKCLSSFKNKDVFKIMLTSVPTCVQLYNRNCLETKQWGLLFSYLTSL